jgi:hypothetical protein
MAKRIKITIENKLLIEQRDMNVYHHALKSAHMISHNSSITLPFTPVVAHDFIYISLVSGPGHIKSQCLVNLPSWLDFEFLAAAGNVKVTHSGQRTLVKIPPGPPGWELKLTRSFSFFSRRRARVTICEDPQE